MYKVRFYTDADDNSELINYISELGSKRDKNSRIKLTKIRDYIKILSEYGTPAGEPYIKHLDGDIWELRPLRDRILFAAWVDGGYVLLHYFVKKTQKTPKREITQAKKNLADYVARYERGELDE